MKPIRKMLKATTLTLLLGISSLTFAMTTYTVQRGDSLWSVASKNQISGVNNAMMINAIKGINASESPGIMDANIRVGQRLAIPTSRSEVQDGLKLYDARMNPFAAATPAPATTTTAPTSSTGSTTSTTTATPSTTAVTQTTSDTPDTATVPDAIEPLSSSHLDAETITPVGNASESSNSNWFINGLWIVLFVGITVYIARRRKLKRKNAQDNGATYITKVAPTVTTYESQTFNVNPLDSVTQAEPKPEMISAEELLQEVEAHILENDTAQAKFLLQQAINYKMRDLAIYIKLLEVYAIEGDIISFNSQRDYLLANVIPYDHPAWRDIDRIYNQYLSKHY